MSCLEYRNRPLGKVTFFIVDDIYTGSPTCVSTIIIMYIYHALMNALSAHMIHINLNMIFCIHVEHSPTKTIYVKYYTKSYIKNTHYKHTHTHTHARTHARTHAHTRAHTHTHTHTDCSRNCLLILVRMEIL